MYIGIDLGTSGVKAILLNEQGEVVASHTEKLTVSRPHPLWSEQDPEQWWLATDTAMKTLGAQHSLRDVKALGIAGQMHGATLLDKSLQVLRPAILWNDGRCAEECQLLEDKVSASRQITGNLMMPGFTAPKLLWVQRHEAAVFSQVDKVLLPKDYLRLRMTGELASDMSDAAGTMWLDVARRDWSDEMLAACDLSRDAMPALFEGSDVTGQLRPEVAQAWNMPPALVVGGGGDNAAGAVGVGMADAGQAMLSLGTSGVYFAVSEGFLSKPESAVHSFCHALPGRWHLMSVMLSAASCLDWAAKLTGLASVPALIAAAQTADESAGPVWFLPYLSGERTPHNNPQAKGVFFWPDASAWAGRAGAGGAGRGGLCAGGWYGRGARLRHQAAEHHAYRRRGAQRLLAANAGGYQRPAARLPYRGRCRPGAGGGQAGAAGGSRRGRPPRAAEAAAA